MTFKNGIFVAKSSHSSSCMADVHFNLNLAHSNLSRKQRRKKFYEMLHYFSSLLPNKHSSVVGC
jgi:hypothetical protein